MMSKNLYDAMPFAYMATGALVTALLDSPLKYMPAMIFFSAGALIFMWRRAGALKRRQQATARVHRRDANTTEKI